MALRSEGGTGYIATSDGVTWTTILTISPNTNEVWFIKAQILARDGSDPPLLNLYDVTLATVVRGSGAPTGNLLGVSTQEDAAYTAADIRLNVSGNTVQVQVLGVAATNLDWSARYTALVEDGL